MPRNCYNYEAGKRKASEASEDDEDWQWRKPTQWDWGDGWSKQTYDQDDRWEWDWRNKKETKWDDVDESWGGWGSVGSSSSAAKPTERASAHSPWQPRAPTEPPPAHLFDADEAWASTDVPFDSRRWRTVLDEHGVDMPAQHTLFLLCQHSAEGARAANSLVGKIVKAVTNQREITNPSAFINSCAMRARHQIEDLYGQGKDSWR